MSILSQWADRMEKIYSKLGKTEFLERHCPYKCDYFCDGRVNKTKGKKTDLKDIEPCKQFKNGRCELSLHLGKEKKEDW